ncbi:hypothetical protein F4556_006238 [Kitasatospora gansuensis]|uniref:Uncharacterized protein n=1 Tax=Kitasatospora gansuensis TaxID=258050 RepID=A0A7W7SHR2_9ACTN|nr:hypothetical protein [Kitasatospora gansuensis]MBB4944838.1 hypothetical protein [Kitasatospora gansuensis]MBB4950703.1 hypothetical protein [Kitasatospora gansuensis]
MTVPERVGQDEEQVLVERTEAVEADLRFVGLPVVRGGDSRAGKTIGSSTFVVYYDASADSSGGVFVTWEPSRELKDLIVASPQLALQRAIPLGSTALEAMTVAVEQVLTAAGWATEQTDVGVHESSVKILGPVPR